MSKNTGCLVAILLGITTLFTVLIVKLASKLRIKEKADVAYEWYKNAMRRLFNKIAKSFRKS